MIPCREMTTTGASTMNFCIGHQSGKQFRWTTLYVPILLVFILAEILSPTPSPANEPTAGESVQHAIGFGALIAVLGVALSIAIVVYRIVRLTAFRSKLCDSQTRASELANVAEQAPPNFGSTVATNAQTGQVQNWMSEQTDQDGEIEVSVRRLLQELKRRYPELHGHDIKPTSESSAPGYGR